MTNGMIARKRGFSQFTHQHPTATALGAGAGTAAVGSASLHGVGVAFGLHGAAAATKGAFSIGAMLGVPVAPVVVAVAAVAVTAYVMHNAADHGTGGVR